MCFVWISEQTAIISLYSINWLVFITETECVYCALRTGSLNVIQVNLCLYRPAMAQAVSRRPFVALARVRSQVSLCQICGGLSGTGTRFSRGISVSRSQYHSTDAAYSSSSTCRSYQKHKRAKHGNLPKSNAVSEIWEHWV
jgi:hypothetical protein